MPTYGAVLFDRTSEISPVGQTFAEIKLSNKVLVPALAKLPLIRVATG